MRQVHREVKNREDNLLRIRGEAVLPSHKVEVSLDDLDQDILFFIYKTSREIWGN